MGSTCGCDITCRKGFFGSEFKLKPIKSNLIGGSTGEENFVRFNSNFHNTDFSLFFSKKGAKQRSNSASPILFQKFSVVEQKYPSKSVLNPDENLIVEGELEKYCPGITYKFASRWCKLTSEGFSYYKNQWASACFNKPLFFIPLEQIKAIKVTENRIQKKNPEFFEFEISLCTRTESEKASRNSLQEPLRVKSRGSFSSPIKNPELDKRLIFGTKDFLTFSTWVKRFESLILSIT